jgi:chromosomal replication initiation ATPase DnaA
VNPATGEDSRIGRVLDRLERHRILRTCRSIAEAHGLSLEAILSRSRLQPHVAARHHLWTVIRHTMLWSYPAMAGIFEVDHTSIIYGVDKREQKLRRELRRHVRVA